MLSGLFPDSNQTSAKIIWAFIWASLGFSLCFIKDKDMISPSDTVLPLDRSLKMAINIPFRTYMWSCTAHEVHCIVRYIMTFIEG